MIVKLIKAFIIACICILGFTFNAWSAPGIHFPETSHNFGLTLNNVIVSHTFVVENQGDEELVIERIQSTCDCTTTSFDKIIPPGGQGKIVVDFNTQGYIGNTVTRQIRVYSNDPAQSPVKLSITVNVENGVKLTPRRVNFTGYVGESLVREVAITPLPEYPFKITGITALDGRNISYELKEKIDGDNASYVLQVANARQLAGRYYDEIIMETDHMLIPTIKVKVNGVIINIPEN